MVGANIFCAKFLHSSKKSPMPSIYPTTSHSVPMVAATSYV
jgi:hypothetical protein